jgi:RNA polymerase sigma factor (sigma-70 family)
MDSASDSELLRRFAEGRDEAAFGVLVRRQLNLVYSVALRQVGGDAHLAQDVVQRVFTDLARKAPALSRRATLGGWLYRATRFTAADLVRAERARRVREQEAQTMHDPSPDSNAADWEKLRPLLDEAISELREPDRDALLLRFFEARPFAEIGAALRTSEDAARMRVERALGKLHIALTRRGVTSTSAALGLALANQASVAAPVGLATSVTATAVAGAAASGGASVLLTLLTMSKIKTTIVGVIVAACLTTAVVEMRANRVLRAELTPVSGRDEENRVARLQGDNQRLSALAKKAGEKNPEIDELMRMRNRIAGLKARPPGVVDEEMRPPRNLGRATPAAAIETFCWALDQGDLDLAASFMTFSDDSEEQRAAFMANFSPAVRERYRTPERLCSAAFFGLTAGVPNPQPAMQVVSVEEDHGPDDVRVKIWWRTPDGKEAGGGSTYRRRADGWAEKPFSLTKPSLMEDVRKRIDPATGNFIMPANANR